MSSLRFQYQTIEFGKSDIHLRTLRDKQQYSDDDDIAENLGISSANWSLFGVVWDSSKVLANVMFDYEIEGKRILEIGCGIALSSLMLSQRQADITATDYHPEVESFLLKNIQLNDGKKIPFFRTGWADTDIGMGKFDVVIGSDILYESEHVAMLSSFIDQHTQSDCEVIIVDPGRGNHARFSKKMVSLGYTHSQSKPENIEYLTLPFKGQILRYQRQT
ncbi:MAG: protein N-lysine methyltransferase family protein [Gammaproteobacteria bacterium]|nr:protein N-lysine methyltransferase family protein [Gammaproteobacteria bacterium]MCW8986587.1 protein N-lysine methyltransferase family protein [Gammaproteobacteria bacterium]MCW9032499.1 protein N-lysine methyltransferase family protein [Gammaproteobacteria bacterium]